jgi:Hypothetical protein (DUF2513).
MKLNHDCVREVLLCIEENMELNDQILPNQLVLHNYTYDEIAYTVQKLIEAGFIKGKDQGTMDDAGLCLIFGLTWNGHEFLDTIRDPRIFSETQKKILSTVGSTSLSIVASVATSITKSLLGI